jgi:hypothetical protein
MSYEGISVKDAIESINKPSKGWFLPAVQRPYVWGSRYENEQYILKLFDSLLRGYPIGGLIIWQTRDFIPYRHFLQDYSGQQNTELVDEGLSNPTKRLVYDGQQRLQTLYSCLLFTFNGQVLVFDLTFDLDKADRGLDETGFYFAPKNSTVPKHHLRLNRLFHQSTDVEFENEVLTECANSIVGVELRVKTNLRNLWKVFVDRDKKSLAYFMIKDKKDIEVNEIFQRLNTGGIPLSQADLLLSRIKEGEPRFEEDLQKESKDIFRKTGAGYHFSSYEALQLAHLVFKGTLKLDPKTVKSKEDSKDVRKVWGKLQDPLKSFFSDFLYGQFKVNNAAIIPKRLALLPLMVYFYELYQKEVKYKNLSSSGLAILKRYFILSQVNDWNLPTLVDSLSRKIKDRASVSTDYFDFPLDGFIEELSLSKRRETELYEARFKEYTWFSLKVLTPDRLYIFDPDDSGRFLPEIDHIFPVKLSGRDASYSELVDVIWNMQPVKGEVNNYKRRKSPQEFFKNEGKKYLEEYDHLPSQNPDEAVWSNPYEFIARRREIMIAYLKTQYDLLLRTN